MHLEYRGRAGSESISEPDDWVEVPDEDDEEYEQPALEYEPVGLPEPCGVIPECTIHCSLTCISDDVGNEAEHTDEETGNHGVFTCLWSNLLKEDTHCKYGYHGWSQE